MNIGLAQEIATGSGVVEFCLSWSRDIVDLEASTIIEGTSRNEFAAFVASVALGIPYAVDAKICITVQRLSCAVDEDCASPCWLAEVVEELCDMSVFEVAECHLIPRSCTECWKAVALLTFELIALAHKVCWKKCVSSPVGREKVEIHIWIASSWTETTNVAWSSNVASVRRDEPEFLYPGVGVDRRGAC